MFAEDNEERDIIIQNSAQKLGLACLEFIQDIYIRQRLQAVRTAMVQIQEVIEACADLYEEGEDNEMARQFLDLQRGLFLTVITIHTYR